jgi:hypothetical protein
MDIRRSSVLMVAAAACLACSEAPTAPVGSDARALRNAQPFLPGEQQPLVDFGVGGLAIYPVGQGQILQQTFTPSSSGWLGYLELPVSCEAGVLLNVKVRDGLNGPILYEANVIGLTGPYGTFNLIQVYNPAVTKNGIKIKKGHEYAFELSAFPGPNAVGITCGIARGPAGNSYLGGRGYYSDPLTNGPAFIPIPNGSPTDDQDLPFITLVR